MTEPVQSRVRCVIIRGGTNKGLYFHEADLPAVGSDRDAVLLRLTGSPDVLQIDGLGGSRPITSKVAIVGRQRRPTPMSTTPSRRSRSTGPSSATPATAATSPPASARSPSTRAWSNRSSRSPGCGSSTPTHRPTLITEVPVRDRRAQVTGDFAIPGVPGRGAEIVMNWVATIGAKTGQLLPTGAPSTTSRESARTVHATLCDAGNPCVLGVRAHMGCSGSELADEHQLQHRTVGHRQGNTRPSGGAHGASHKLEASRRPITGTADCRPRRGAPGVSHALRRASRGETTWTCACGSIFMNRLHESIAGSASICLAAASRIPGSVVERVADHRRHGQLLIGHPSGVTPTKVQSHYGPHGASFGILGFSRTARRLMDGTAYYPTDHA